MWYMSVPDRNTHLYLTGNTPQNQFHFNVSPEMESKLGLLNNFVSQLEIWLQKDTKETTNEQVRKYIQHE